MKKMFAVVLVSFSRNVDGQIRVGDPDHPEFNGRYLELSPDALTELEDLDLVEEISKAEYVAAEADYEAFMAEKAKEKEARKPGNRRNRKPAPVDDAGAGLGEGDAGAGEAEKPGNRRGRKPAADDAGKGDGVTGADAGDTSAAAGNGAGSGQAADAAPTGGGANGG